jgi:predicted DNA-binding transcriptional regulator
VVVENLRVGVEIKTSPRFVPDMKLPWRSIGPGDNRGIDNQKIGALGGTTLRVYRYLYRQARPLGVHDVQRGLGLSSFSVAQYHIKKLLAAGLIREENEGYVVDRILFENMIRIRRSVIPLQLGYSAFFATTLLLLLTVFRPVSMTGTYVFALVVNVSAFVLFLNEYVKATNDMSIP